MLLFSISYDCYRAGVEEVVRWLANNRTNPQDFAVLSLFGEVHTGAEQGPSWHRTRKSPGVTNLGFTLNQNWHDSAEMRRLSATQ
jgi:hypothetical protein